MAKLSISENDQQYEYRLVEAQNISVDNSGQLQEVEITVGTASDNLLVLSKSSNCLPKHAVFTRDTGSWILIDKSNGDSFVNDISVTLLQVLKHGDQIRLGQSTMEFAEITMEKLQKNSDETTKSCPLCKKKFESGNTVIKCPRCQVAHHRNCWFGNKNHKCAACGAYPTSPSLQIDSYSRLINKIDPCGKPLKKGDHVVLCPKCNTPYHRDLSWVELKKCIECEFVRVLEEETEDP